MRVLRKPPRIAFFRALSNDLSVSRGSSPLSVHRPSRCTCVSVEANFKKDTLQTKVQRFTSAFRFDTEKHSVRPFATHTPASLLNTPRQRCESRNRVHLNRSSKNMASHGLNIGFIRVCVVTKHLIEVAYIRISLFSETIVKFG